MAPVDIEKIAVYYQSFKVAIQASIKGSSAAVEAAITSALAGLDFGLTGKVVKWGVQFVLNQLVDVEAKALSIALRCEYLVRANNQSGSKAAWAAWSLTNKCSLCKCIGHNKRVSNTGCIRVDQTLRAIQVSNDLHLGIMHCASMSGPQSGRCDRDS